MIAQLHQERLLLLEENVTELRLLGKRWNLNDDTVDSCAKLSLLRSINVSIQSRNLLLLTVLAVMVIALGTAYVFVRQGGLPEEVLAYGEYQVTRTLRIIATFLLPKYSFITDYHTEECIVKNPLWVNGDLDCSVCSLSDTIPEYKQRSTADNREGFSFPVISRRLLPHVVTLEDVKSVIVSSKIDLSKPVQSTARWSHTARDFANNATVEKISKSPGFQFHWKSGENLAVGRLMRTLFPRPPVFSDDMEVSVKKYLHIDGPGPVCYNLPDWEGGTAWYAQGSGVRMVTLTPVHQCRDQCSSLQVEVTERDVLFYPAEYWEVSVLPSDEISISHMGACG